MRRTITKTAGTITAIATVPPFPGSADSVTLVAMRSTISMLVYSCTAVIFQDIEMNKLSANSHVSRSDPRG